MSQRAVGGCSPVVPPMAITMGMKDLPGARRIRLLSDTAWCSRIRGSLSIGRQAEAAFTMPPGKSRYPCLVMRPVLKT